MTREQLLALFQIDNDDKVITLGPFFGQPLYIAYFWYLYITGYLESEQDGVVMFFVRGEDRGQFPELKDRAIVRLKRLPDGRIVEEQPINIPGVEPKPGGNGLLQD